MHALHLLQNLLTDALPFFHRTRLKALLAAVGALLRGGNLSLTALGRQMPLPLNGHRRHQIKRVDRLLKNAALHKHRQDFFRIIAHRAIGTAVRVPIIVDWTPVGEDNANNALVASLPCGGRVVAIYAEVHPLKKLSNPNVERQFLKRLKLCIPTHCKPIVITDAGFRMPWFQSVLKQGWDFIGRGRGHMKVQDKKGLTTIRELFKRAKRQPTDLGQVLFTQKAYPVRMILVREKHVHRKQKQKSKQKRRKLPEKRVQMSEQERYRASAREPWLLLTSCRRLSPRRIVTFYKSRMAIEETFRDLKSHRFGWSFEDARCRSSARFEILLLIASLALFIVIDLPLEIRTRG